MLVNHLRNHYSDYVFLFIKRYIDELSIDMKIGDMGAGHLRNLKLFEKLGFYNLYALDKEKTDNPLKVNLKEFVLQDLKYEIPFDSLFFDITLCNYVLMFIDQSYIYQVLDELMRVTNKFLIIETNKQKDLNYKNTHFKDYNFLDIVNHIKKNANFELLQVRYYYEKLTARRISHG